MTLSTYRGEGIGQYGLVNNHAYAIVGVDVLYDNDAPSHYLVKVFNPWRNDEPYNGTFND